MTRSIIRSVVMAAILAVGGTVLAAEQRVPKTSPAFGDQFTAADAARKANNWTEVVTKAKEVLASDKRKPDDTYAAHYFLVEASTALKDVPGQIAALEGMIESGFLSTAEQNPLRRALTTAYYKQKDFAQTLKHGNELVKNGGADEPVYTVMAQSHYQMKNYAETVKLIDNLVSSAEKAGRKPDRQQLSLLYSAHDKAGNAQAAQGTLESLVRHYPTADTWGVLLYEVKKENLDPRQKLHLYRLMDATGNLRSGQDFMAYSEAATAVGLPAEASAALERGLKAEAWKEQEEKDRASRYLASNKTRAETAQAELGKLEGEAKAAPTGNDFVALGMAQYSFGDHGKSIEALKAGISRGSLRFPDDAQITLGTVQLKAGNKSEAAQTFRSVKTDNPVTQRIVKLWTLYAS
jgi:hypothetical protein